MPGQHNFEHLPLIKRTSAPARLRGGKSTSPQTVANRNARKAHSESLLDAARATTATWKALKSDREAKSLPDVGKGIPLLLRIDPELDLDVLRESFEFEVIAEQEDGYVIVASEKVDLARLTNMIALFIIKATIRGTAAVASIHELVQDPGQSERLRRILSEGLFAIWQTIADADQYIVDVSVACTGQLDIPEYPTEHERESDATWARREAEWTKARLDAYESWDELKQSREQEIKSFVAHYKGEIQSYSDDLKPGFVELPDSIAVRIKISGLGLRDLVFNYPYIFEVAEPDHVSIPQQSSPRTGPGVPSTPPQPPHPDAPAVCVIDSGIQEGHLLLHAAVDQPTSRCFLPGRAASEVSDQVRPGGHGTRVAGAVVYGESISNAHAQFPCWIQNARVLDEWNKMPVELFPPVAVRRAIEHFHFGPRRTRIFNHSINSMESCRLKYMSAWAAEIDSISAKHDVLVIQSAGNVFPTNSAPQLGIKEHLDAGRTYPHYLVEPSCRVANPGQSLQALTVGSVAYGAFSSNTWRTFATQLGHPSAFSRTGFGIWDAVKPEVVEYGGDAIHQGASPTLVQTGGLIPQMCPELVRSTMYPPGPASDRDEVGTSFATPKVARIAAQLQQLFPGEPALLYRALIVQSARWPEWAEAVLAELRMLRPKKDKQRREELFNQTAAIIRHIGYGIPTSSRALSNTDHRVTFITNGVTAIKARDCDIYQIPIPAAIRGQADEFDIRIEVTLSYVAEPRRTRRNRRRYLSTWVDWKSSRLGESMDGFRSRALKGEAKDEAAAAGSTLPWVIHENEKFGLIRNTKRNAGTVQKDWAIVKSYALPDHFCIAVVGHEGWSRDPDATAKYVLAVTIEIVGQEMKIYEPLRVAVEELRQEIALDAAEVEG